MPDAEVLDLCTGSGCIGISIQSFCPDTKVTGADISKEALQVAKHNALQNQVPVSFVHSNLFSEISGRFDMIVSNPPYIPSNVIDTLMPEVRDHEPMGALDGKADGLYFYRILAEECAKHLTPGGHVYFEIGYDQGMAVKKLLDNHGFKDTRVIQDLAGKDRVVCGAWQTAGV